MNGTIEETPPPEGLPPSPAPAAEAGRPLAGRVALVTGASRGIGAADDASLLLRHRHAGP